MGIVASAAASAKEALERLRSTEAAERDAAVARLTLIGRRAVAHLSAALPGLPTEGRVAALEVLERIGDGPALAAVLSSLRDPEPAVSVRAAGAAARLGDPAAALVLAHRLEAPGLAGALAAAEALGRLSEGGSVECLDLLLSFAVDESRDDERRLAAVAAASRVATPDLRRILDRLAMSASPRVAADAQARVAGSRASHRWTTPSSASSAEGGRSRMLVARATVAAGRADARRRWLAAVEAEGAQAIEAVNEALDRTVDPEAAMLLAEAAGLLARPASIPVLRDALSRWRDTSDSGRVGAAIHEALGALGSRVALEDLRSRLGLASGPTGATLARVAGLIGDSSFVAPLASLAFRDPDAEPTCAAAFLSLASRHELSPRSRAVIRLPGSLRALIQRWWSLRD